MQWTKFVPVQFSFILNHNATLLTVSKYFVVSTKREHRRLLFPLRYLSSVIALLKVLLPTSLLFLPESDYNLDSISIPVNQSLILQARISEKVLFSIKNIEIALQLSRSLQFYIRSV
jgi:hypothetical protein